MVDISTGKLHGCMEGRRPLSMVFFNPTPHAYFLTRRSMAYKQPAKTITSVVLDIELPISSLAWALVRPLNE